VRRAGAGRRRDPVSSGLAGRPGSFPGQFNQVHGIAVDSKGNVYLDENRGRRVHKFVPVAQ
jgi:hypothetical protein